MSEELGQDELVVAITATDDWLHAGTVAEMLGHGRSHRDGEGHPGGAPGGRRVVDVFDAEGAPVRPVLDECFEVIGFARVGPADAGAVRARLDLVMDRSQAFLDQHPGGGTGASWPALTQVPRPRGSLEEVIAGLRRATTGDPAHHSSGWFHNLLHAMGG